MSEVPSTPFPELHALEQRRPFPTLRDLLGDAAACPAPPARLPSPPDSSVLHVPLLPDPHAVSRSAPTPGDPPAVAPMPVGDREETLQETLAALMAEDLAPLPGSAPEPPDPAPSPAPPAPGNGAPNPAAIDVELANAFRPIVDSSLAQALTSRDVGLQTFLEPMLRSTVRRAIAEQMESARQFKQLGGLDRLGLRFLALLTGRSYEDILFTRTRCYQVEEVFLLRRKARTLLSYASHDPARHVSVRRVQSTVRALVSKLQAPDGTIETTFDLPERRLALIREGEHALLVAVLRGRSNALVRADLDYVLRQVEERFGARLEDRSDAFLTVLQPLLEGCLLIQSPAPPH